MPECNPDSMEKQYSQLKQYIETLPEKKGSLIDVLHKAQEIFGYLPEQVQEFTGRELGIPLAKVYGVVMFYSFFSMTPKGRYNISICMGTACYINGSQQILEEFEKVLGIKVGQVTEDGKFSLNTLRCVGACGLAPVVMIEDKVYPKVIPSKIRQIIKGYIEDSVREDDKCKK